MPASANERTVRYILTCTASRPPLLRWSISHGGPASHSLQALTADRLAQYLTRARLIDVTPSGTVVRVRIGYQAPRGATLNKHLEITQGADRFLGSVGLQLIATVVSEMSGEWAAEALTPAIGAGPAGVVGELVGVVAAREVKRYLFQRGPLGWTSSSPPS